MSDFDRKRFTRDRTEQELLDPATIQNIIANKLREQYIGKRKSEIPLWILDASGVNDKFVKKAKSTIEIRNYNERQTYRDIISSDPWIQDFIDEDQYNKIVQQQDYGANDTEPQDVNLSLTPKPSITIESIPKCPESIQYTLESLVDQA